MLSPKDIENSSRKSGYDNVRLVAGGVRGSFTPYYSARIRKGRYWDGGARATALEAAQDYCDQMNRFITIDDILNPKRKSGFDHVSSASPGPNASGGYSVRWRAQSGGWKAGKQFSGWRGPTRAVAEEAAQDYCDYVNGQNTVTPATLKSAGHAYDIENTERDPEVEAALGVLRDAKAQRAGRQGYVYLIVEGTGKTPVFGKIGYSVNPGKRVAELQTGNPRTLRVYAKLEGTPSDERALHTKYIDKNVLQEWFFITPDLLKEFKGA